MDLSSLPGPVPDRLLEPRELLELARGVGEQEDAWQECLGGCAQERSYASYFLNEYVGVWIIEWREDAHDTGYHDHDRSCGGVHVARGAIRHEKLRLGQRPVGTRVDAGDGFCFDRTAIHRMRREPGAGPTVTVHAYSPPLEHTGQYGQHEDGLLHRVPTSSEQSLQPTGHQGTPTGRVGDAAADRDTLP
ncbi:cupin domain-containing protein [Streptomyces apricus]|uniref:Cysteine dioxygenase n=1 Tax=Streptomyces apricus TaxID=1828112 RepID=A0A5B0BI01_9ACTN|nr:cysteine dioxygenase [Streptomyces apricus]KAA0940245.1 cysteine dioxygenase [Streptomyces apricus]